MFCTVTSRRCLAAAVAAALVGAGLSATVPQVNAQPAAEVPAKVGTSFVADGLHVSVTPAEVPGVWRVDVRPAKGAAPAAAAELPGVAVDAQSGQITIHNDAGDPAWTGRVTPLEAFGRASVPGLQVAWDAADGEAIYGLGERFDSFNQAGKAVELWIEDAPGQGDDASRTYYATPVFYSSAGYALFATTNPEARAELNNDDSGTNRYQRAGREATFYVATGESLEELMGKRTAIHGQPRPIPEWAWGPWISKNSYETQAEAEAAIQGHLDRGNPVAAIVQEAWKGPSETGDFNNFSTERWPDVEGFLAFCKQHDIHNVLWQVPIIHPSSPYYAEGVEKGYFVLKPDGTVSHRQEWLAGFANVDFTNPEAVAWWKDMMRKEVRMGVFGFKADDGEDIKPDDVFHDGRRGWEMHNEYSTLYNKALTEIFDEEGVPGMLWARSGSLGLESYPALWAGDQGATWQQMASLVPAGLSTGVSGMPYWSHDIGGYFGEGATPELYIRWLQFGTLSPLMQYHGVQAREPWTFGPTADEAYQMLSRLRMNLKPALKAIGEEAAATGLPIMRPVFMHYDEARFRGDDTQYLLGRDMLVAPVLDEGATGRLVKFPAGVWHHALAPVAFNGPGEYEVPVGMIDAPLFVREGTHLPVQLAEGQTLGTWSADAPTRQLSFDADRALVTNLRVPLVGDPVGRRTTLSFEPAAGVNDYAVTWWWADAPNATYKANVEITTDGRRLAKADLTPDAGERVVGRRQVWQLTSDATGGSDAPRLRFRGEIDWRSPLTVEATTEGSRVAAGNDTRTVTTTLRNRSGHELTTTLHAEAATATATATVEPKQQDVTVPPHGQATAEWQVTLADTAGRVGDARVSFRATADELQLADTMAVFAFPGRWVVAGPFPAVERMAHATAYPPEWSTAADVAFETGDGQTVQWRQLPEAHLAEHGGINFAEAFGEREQAAGYAMTQLHSDSQQPVELRFGSDDTLTVWLNGEQVHSIETYRGAEPDQEVVPVTLNEGTNTIVAKVGQDVAGWEMLFRVTAPEGKPVTGVTDGFTDATWATFDPERPTADEVLKRPDPYDWRVMGPVSGVPVEADGWRLHADQQALAAADDPTAEGWQPVPADAAAGNRIDLNDLLGPTGNAVAYLATDVVVEKPTDVVLVSGSDDGLAVWLNGELVYRAEQPREFKPGSDRVKLTLPAGRNTLLFRVSQGGGDWMFQAQLQDAQGRPLAVGQE